MRKLSLEKMITSFVFWKKKRRFGLVKKKLRGHLERIQSGEQVPDQMVEINASSDDTPEIIGEDDNLQPEYVELDEGIDNDYIEGELSLNDDLEGEGYDEHLF